MSHGREVDALMESDPIELVERVVKVERENTELRDAADVNATLRDALVEELEEREREATELRDALAHSERTIGNLVDCIRKNNYTEAQRTWQADEGQRIRAKARAVLDKWAAT